MAKCLNYESEIQQGEIVQSWHVSQSVDALTGADDYDITISGSLTLTGSAYLNPSKILSTGQEYYLAYNNTTGQIFKATTASIKEDNDWFKESNQLTSSLPILVKGTGEIVKLRADSVGGEPTISFYQLDERRSRIQHNNEGDALTLISENPSGDVSRLEFYTKTQSDVNPSMKMRITDDGRFLLNTSAIPTTTRFEIDNDGSNTNLTFTKGGNLGLGIYNPTYKLHVVGSGYFSSNLEVSNITFTTKLISGPDHSGFWGKDNVNILGSNITADAANYTYVNNLNISGSLKDSSGDTGTSGQILSSTGTGLNWINNTDLGDYSPYITGSVDTGILPTATTANNCTTIGNNSTIAGGTLNTSSAVCSFIGGGKSNSITGCELSNIVGGQNNTISGGYNGFIGAGSGNSLSVGYGCENVIVGGNNNDIAAACGANYNIIGGGSSNTISGDYTTDSGILGGTGNCINGHDNSFIIGSNLTSTADCTTYVNNLDISGSLKDSSGDTGSAGQVLSSTGTGLNWINNSSGGDGDWYDGTTYISSSVEIRVDETISGSSSIIVGSGITNNGSNIFSIGGNNNIQCANSSFNGFFNANTSCISGSANVVVGGFFNQLHGASTNVIVGGSYNCIKATNGQLGGAYNAMIGGLNNSIESPTRGTDNNTIYGQFIGGGRLNKIHTTLGNGGEFNSIIGGQANQISGSDLGCTFIGGGQSNSISGSSSHSAIIGGIGNCILDHTCTIIIGSNITATADCTTFVNNLNISGSLADSDGDLGSAGQILSSTGTGLNWIDNSGGGGDGDYSPYITGSTSTGILPTATSANNCTTIGNNSTIAGGILNTGSENCIFIGGGSSNSITGGNGNHGVIVGGNNNTLSDSYCGFIGGGSNNCLAGSNAGQVVVGGENNTVFGENSGILGGFNSCINSQNSSIVGGTLNTASADCSFIGGGYSNYVGQKSTRSVIVGGTNNTASNSNYYGNDNFIGAGCNNSISSYCDGCNFIGGGCNNTISGYGSNNLIVGGCNNSNSGYNSGILGGQNNDINTYNQTFIIGSDITAAASCTTYVNNIHVTGSTTANAILQLSRRETTPTGAEGMIIASGSAGASKLYYYNGSTWNALF